MNTIANAIKNNDYPAYQQERYPAIPDGEPVVFSEEDFSGTNFGAFALGFFEFHDCTLDEVRGFYGQPITIEGGTARGIDLQGARLILRAVGCDFTGMKYDGDTLLAYGEKGADAASEFIDCTLDKPAKEYFVGQGVKIAE